MRTLDYWTEGTRPFLILSLLVFFTAIPGIMQLAPVDRDEARFMQATKQMIETGDYAQIRFQDTLRDKKPPGVYWLQALSVKAFAGGQLDTTIPYRIPGVIATWFAVIATFLAGCAAAGPRAGLFAGVILATTALVSVESHLAKADATLLGLSAVCFAVMSRAYTRTDGGCLSVLSAAVFWGALGLSILVKGPILPAIVVLSAASLCLADMRTRWIAHLRPVGGTALALAVAGIWPLVTGWDEAVRLAASALQGDLLPKLAGSHEGHGAPPGTHTLALAVTFWPWAAVLPLTAWTAWVCRDQALVKFCLAWIIPLWLLLELIPTKLPHYVLPLFPALAVLAAIPIAQPLNELPRAMRIAGNLVIVTHVAIALAVLAALAVADSDGYLATVPIGAAAALAVVAATGVSLARWGVDATILRISFCAAIIFAVVFGRILPHVEAINVSRRVVDLVRPLGSAEPTVLVGYHEPSAVFLLGTDTILTDIAGATAILAEGRAENFVIAREFLVPLLSGAAAIDREMDRIGDISGYNYGRGAQVDLVVFRAQAIQRSAGNE